MTKLFSLFFLIIIGSSTPTPTYSWWSFWKDQDQIIEEVQPITRSFRAIRENSCGSKESINSFGETEYMRGEESSDFTTEERSILAAATISESEEVTRKILSPLLNSKQSELQKVAILTLSFWVLKHSNKSKTSLKELNTLLNNPILDTSADKFYLQAVIAFITKDWDKVMSNAKQATELSPLYYNAQVLLAIEKMRRLSDIEQSCNAVTRDLQEILLPVLKKGACPTHVAYLDLAIEKYDLSDHDERSSTIRQILLSYIAKNERECLRQVGLLQNGSFGAECRELINNFTCN